MKIAIILIGYNRLSGIERLVSSLEKADYGDDYPTLIFSIDKSDSNEVTKYAEQYTCTFAEKRVRTFSENQGLKKHILSCGEFFKEFDELIILEDDMYVSPSFYSFAKACGEKYANDENIAGISLYTHLFAIDAGRPFVPMHCGADVYFMKYAQSWGEVWTKQSWLDFYSWYQQNKSLFDSHPDLPENVCHWSKSSWLKYHIRYCVEKNKYFVYPYTSLATCFADVGVHSRVHSAKLQVPLQYGAKNSFDLIDFCRDDNRCVIYDQYFESEALRDKNGMVCDVNLYGRRKNCTSRYMITCRRINYKVIKSWGLDLRPIECNVIYDIPGNDIFLYDMEKTEKGTGSSDCTKEWLYHFRTDGLAFEELKTTWKIIYKKFIARMRVRLIK